MRLDTEKVRKAGNDVLALRDEVMADQTEQALVEAQGGLLGLSITEALAAAANGHREFQGRFGGELDYFGNAMTATAEVVEATEEQGKASFESLDIAG